MELKTRKKRSRNSRPTVFQMRIKNGLRLSGGGGEINWRGRVGVGLMVVRVPNFLNFTSRRPIYIFYWFIFVHPTL